MHSWNFLKRCPSTTPVGIAHTSLLSTYRTNPIGLARPFLRLRRGGVGIGGGSQKNARSFVQPTSSYLKSFTKKKSSPRRNCCPSSVTRKDRPEQVVRNRTAHQGQGRGSVHSLGLKFGDELLWINRTTRHPKACPESYILRKNRILSRTLFSFLSILEAKSHARFDRLQQSATAGHSSVVGWNFTGVDPSHGQTHRSLRCFHSKRDPLFVEIENSRIIEANGFTIDEHGLHAFAQDFDYFDRTIHLSRAITTQYR